MDANVEDLYGELGVDREADESAIRSAFRRKAKTAHPDAGGSPEAWSSLQQALQVLTDPRARDHYNKTGKVEPPGPDVEHALLLTMITEVLLKAVVERDVDHDDIPAKARQILAAALNDRRRDRSEIEKAIKRMDNVRKRLKKKSDGPDFLDGILGAQIADAHRQLYTVNELITRGEKVIEILKGYEYRQDARPDPWKSQQQWFTA